MDEATHDLRLRGASVFIHGSGLSDVDVLVDGNKIVGLVAREDHSRAVEDVDVSGHWIPPGAIDPHVHLGKDIRVPRDADDAEKESASAVSGGVTSMLVYLMSGESYSETFQSAKELMARHSHAHFGFHFVLGSPEHLTEFPTYVEDYGVSSFKFFMNFRGEEGAYLGIPGNDDGFMYDLLSLSAKHGAMINPHPENVELLRRLRVEPPDESQGPLWAWHKSRPSYVEAEAQQRVTYLASVTGASVYCVHTSSAEALRAAVRQREHYPNIFVETCPHYLTLSTESPAVGTYGKVNPPIRPPEDGEAMWVAMQNAQVDCIGSDHNARHRKNKETDIWSASAGFPGVGTMLLTTLSAGLSRGVDLTDLVNVTSTRAAQLFGMYPRKGTIRVGSDADLVVIDPGVPTTLSAERLHSAAEYTPWEGAEVSMSIRHTLVRGRFAVKDGELTDACAGEYLSRRHSGAAALKSVHDRERG